MVAPKNESRESIAVRASCAAISNIGGVWVVSFIARPNEARHEAIALLCLSVLMNTSPLYRVDPKRFSLINPLSFFSPFPVIEETATEEEFWFLVVYKSAFVNTLIFFLSSIFSTGCMSVVKRDNTTSDRPTSPKVLFIPSASISLVASLNPAVSIRVTGNPPITTSCAIESRVVPA